MKGIMRKRLAALLSMAGFAAGATPGRAQVVKSSEPGNQTRTESTVKDSKATREKHAGTVEVKEKVGADHIVKKHIGGVKYEKTKAETKAAKSEVTRKAGKANFSAQAASKDAAKTTKNASEKTAVTTEALGKGEQKKWITNGTAKTKVRPDYTRHKKGSKTTAESKAADKNVPTKDQTTPK